MANKPLIRETRFSEEDFRRIMHLAARLEVQHAGSMTLTELRQVAAEANVSADALEAALQEHRRAQEAGAPRLRHLPKLAVKFTGVGIGVAAIYLAGGPVLLDVLPFSRGTLLSLVLSGCGLVVSLIRGKRGSAIGVLEFEARNAGLFVGFAAGFHIGIMLISGSVLPPMTRVLLQVKLLSLWAGTSAAGGLIAAWRARSGARADASQ